MAVAYIIGGIIIVLVAWYIKRKTFRCSVVYPEGQFRILGNKRRFRIKKGDRFEFIVKDGRIISCIDKHSSRKPIIYGGGIDGNS